MYNKLFSKILDSSIWLEPSDTRIVWLMMIAVMDEDGFCQFASPANVAHRARVPLEEAEAALRCLEGPDPNSSDADNDGRRLQRVPGGWLVLNAGKYRELVSREVTREQTRDRVRRYRDRLHADGLKEKSRGQNDLQQVTAGNAPLHAVTSSESESETEVRTPVPRAREDEPAPPPPTTAPEPAPSPPAIPMAVIDRASQTLVAGTLPRDHLRCLQPCGRVCLPLQLGRQFARQLGGDEATALDRVRAFRTDVLDAIPDTQEIGDDPFSFWRRWFASKFPSAAPDVGPGHLRPRPAGGRTGAPEAGKYAGVMVRASHAR